MKKTVWKILLALECGIGLISFMMGIGWAINNRYDGSNAGIAFLCAVGLLNAALLTVIVDKLSSKSCKESQDEQEI